MRRVLFVVVLAGASGALARAPAAPAAVWADWVGDWQGKLRWTSCTSEGEPSASFELDATDGAVAIDLTGMGGGIGAVSLVEDNGGWSGQQADFVVRVARPHDGALEVAVELDSGCHVNASLRRTTVGIAACDRLAGWARIESRCTKLSKPPRENLARLVRQRAEWEKTRVAQRGELAAQCEARAAKVETELVDVGCAPNPDPAIGLRGAECQALRQVGERIARCSGFPPDMRAQLASDAAYLAGTAQQASAATLPVIEHSCKQLRERLAGLVRNAGCPP
jgi:hypothetical protein